MKLLKPFTILPNTCSSCGNGPFTTVYAPNQDQADAGSGLCPECAGVTPVTQQPGAAVEVKQLKDMTKTELLEKAEEMALDVPPNATKQALLDLIAAAQ